METNAVEKPRKSAGKIVLRVLLWIILAPLLLALLLAGGTLAYLFLSNLPYDTAKPDMEPMAAAERVVAVDPAEQTFTLAIDKGDIWWVAARENLLEPLLADAEELLSDYDLTVDRYGLQIGDGRVFVTARLAYRDWLPIPVRAELVPTVRDGYATFCIERASIGKLLSVPLGLFGVSTGAEGDAVYILEENLHPRLDQLQAVRAEGDRLLFTFGFTEKGDLIAEIESPNAVALDRSQFLTCDAARVQYAHRADAVDAEADDPAILIKCEETPAYLIEFKRQVLAVGDEAATAAFFAARDVAYDERFFPDVTPAGVEALRAEYDAETEARASAADALAGLLFEACAAGRVTIAPDAILLDGAPMTVQALAGADAERYDWFDFDSVQLVLLDELNAETTPYPPKTEGLPKLSDVLTEEGALGESDVRLPAAVGLVFRAPSGGYRMTYLCEDGAVQREAVLERVFKLEAESDAVRHWPGADPEALAILREAAQEAGFASLAEATTVHVSKKAKELLQNQAYAKKFALAVLRYMPALTELDLTDAGGGAGYISKSNKAILRSILPQLTIAWPEAA